MCARCAAQSCLPRSTCSLEMQQHWSAVGTRLSQIECVHGQSRQWADTRSCVGGRWQRLGSATEYSARCPPCCSEWEGPHSQPRVRSPSEHQPRCPCVCVMCAGGAAVPAGAGAGPRACGRLQHARAQPAAGQGRAGRLGAGTGSTSPACSQLPTTVPTQAPPPPDVLCPPASVAGRQMPPLPWGC